MDDVERLARIVAAGRTTRQPSETVARKILEVGFVRLPDVDRLAEIIAAKILEVGFVRLPDVDRLAEIIAATDPGAKPYKIARRIIETLT